MVYMKTILTTVAVVLLCYQLSKVSPQNANRFKKRTNQSIDALSYALVRETQSDKENLPRISDLIKRGADVNKHDIVSGIKYYAPIQYASQQHHWKTVRLLVSKKALVEPDTPFGDEHYLTPLMYCAKFGPYSLLKTLLEHGANINAKGYHNLTALMLAVQSGKVDNVKMLIKYKPDMNARSYFSHKTALDFAKERKSLVLTRLLSSGQGE